MVELQTGNDFVDDFISLVQKRLKKAKHKMIISLGSGFTIEGSKCDGYYCEEEKELAISVSSDLDSWLGVLVHEFNHFLQAQAKTAKWIRLEYNGANCYETWWDWIAGNLELSEHDLEEIVRRIQDVEHECECMTIEMVEKLMLPIKLEQYISNANAYIFFFQYAKRFRKWYSDSGPSQNDIVAKYLSKQKMEDDYYHLPLSLVECFSLTV